MAEVHNFPASAPYNSVAEQAVLGAILADNSVYDRLIGTLKATDFHEPLHAELYEAIENLIRDERRADLVTLTPTIKDKKIGEADALSYVQTLPEFAPTSPEELWDYAREITRYSAQRQILATATMLGQEAGRFGVNLLEVSDAAVRRIDEALATTRARAITNRPADEYIEQALEAYGKTGTGISTGLHNLDDLTGGLFPGEITFLGGRPGSGKTTLATQIALNCALAKQGTLFFSLEMTGITLGQRLASRLAWMPEREIPYFKFRRQTITAEELERLRAARQSLVNKPLVLEEQPALSLAQINGISRKTQVQLEARGFPLKLIVVDYLTLIKMSDRYKGQRVNEVTDLSAGLKELSRRMNVHVLCLHQLNRGVEGREDKRPQLHDLRDSGSTEQDADNVIFTFREEYYIEREPDYDDPDKAADKAKRLDRAKNKMDVILAKQRMGAVGTKQFFSDIGSNVVADLATIF